MDQVRYWCADLHESVLDFGKVGYRDETMENNKSTKSSKPYNKDGIRKEPRQDLQQSLEEEEVWCMHCG